MITWVSISEAKTHSEFTHEHISLLARTGKINARKSATVWLIDLDSLKEYEQRMRDLGDAKHTPHRFSSFEDE